MGNEALTRYRISGQPFWCDPDISGKWVLYEDAAAALKAAEAERDEAQAVATQAQLAYRSMFDHACRLEIIADRGAAFSLKDANDRAEKAAADLAAARTENDRLREGLRPLLSTAKLLLENSRLCAVQHHGFNEETDPVPGWLVDARKEVDGAAALLSDQAGKAT